MRFAGDGVFGGISGRTYEVESNLCSPPPAMVSDYYIYPLIFGFPGVFSTGSLLSEPEEMLQNQILPDYDHMQPRKGLSRMGCGFEPRRRASATATAPVKKPSRTSLRGSSSTFGSHLRYLVLCSCYRSRDSARGVYRSRES